MKANNRKIMLTQLPVRISGVVISVWKHNPSVGCLIDDFLPGFDDADADLSDCAPEPLIETIGGSHFHGAVPTAMVSGVICNFGVV